MGWGWIRIGIFIIGFLAGFLVIGPSRTATSAKSPAIIVFRDHSPQMGRYVVRKVRQRNFD